MNHSVVCIYTFDLNPAATETQILEASARVDALLLKMDGFMYRSLTKTEAGKWQDIIYWQDSAAQEASRSLESTGAFDIFLTLIDDASVSFSKAIIHSQVYPEMDVA